MTTAYTLVFDHLDGDRRIPPLQVAGSGPADLAQIVHWHARGRLGTRRVDVLVHPKTLHGTVRSHGVVVGAFSLTAAEAAPAPVETTSNAPEHLRHGWVLDDVERIAWGVASSDRWHRGMPVQERHDHARYGVLCHVLAADEPPAEYDLFRAGLAEISRVVQSELRFKGRDDESGYGFIPRAAAYWHRPPENTMEERVVERLALHQALPLLTTGQRQALMALAACEDYQRAADALRVTQSSLHARLAGGRARFVAAWFEHESPPPRRRRDRRIYARSGLDSLGRKRVTVSQLQQARARRENGELLREIAPDLGITPQALGALLRGVHKPAPDPTQAGAA
ncbi:hypothetical protein [Streptomyces synnematoformans]|uniref:Uncharacterized protein n=1 Tax=Streptomyces synnematoformans TaxID=415721 RepID=A0ABN2X9Z7_9ACTN